MWSGAGVSSAVRLSGSGERAAGGGDRRRVNPRSPRWPPPLVRRCPWVSGEASSIVTSSFSSVNVEPSEVAVTPSWKSSINHWSWAIRSSGQAIMVAAGSPVHARVPSVTSYAAERMLQPADSCIRGPSKLRLIVDPSTRSCPVTLVETYVEPSRSSVVTAEPDADVDDSSVAPELSSEPHPATPRPTSAKIRTTAADQRVGRIEVLIS